MSRVPTATNQKDKKFHAGGTSEKPEKNGIKRTKGGMKERSSRNPKRRRISEAPRR